MKEVGPESGPITTSRKKQEPRSFAPSKSSNLGALISGLVGIGLVVGVLVFLNHKKRKIDEEKSRAHLVGCHVIVVRGLLELSRLYLARAVGVARFRLDYVCIFHYQR